jgi:hypothetical protein
VLTNFSGMTEEARGVADRFTIVHVTTTLDGPADVHDANQPLETRPGASPTWCAGSSTSPAATPESAERARRVARHGSLPTVTRRTLDALARPWWA